MLPCSHRACIYSRLQRCCLAWHAAVALARHLWPPGSGPESVSRYRISPCTETCGSEQLARHIYISDWADKTPPLHLKCNAWRDSATGMCHNEQVGSLLHRSEFETPQLHTVTASLARLQAGQVLEHTLCCSALSASPMYRHHRCCPGGPWQPVETHCQQLQVAAT